MKRADAYILTLLVLIPVIATALIFTSVLARSLDDFGRNIDFYRVTDNWTVVRQLDGGIQALDTNSGRLCIIWNDPTRPPPDCSKPKR